MSKLEKMQFIRGIASTVCQHIFKVNLWDSKDPKNKELMYQLASLQRTPFGSQVELGILPLKKSLDTYGCGILLGSMGIGKTQIAFSTAALKVKEERNPKLRKILFLTSGGKHLPNMKAEAEKIYGDEAIIKTIVNKGRYEKIGKNEIIPEDVYDEVAPNGQFLVYLMSKDAGKMDLKEENIYNYGDRCPCCNKKMYPKSHKKGMAVSTRIKPSECPSCSAVLSMTVAKNVCMHIKDENGIPITRKPYYELVFDGENNPVLDENGNQQMVLKYTDGLFPRRIAAQRQSGLRKLSVGKRFRRLQHNSMDKLFKILLVDEVHEMQSGTSLQGIFYRDLVNVSETTLIMTGTLSNGYASSVFYILQAVLPAYFKNHGFKFNDVLKFVENYGARKTTKARDIVQVTGSRVDVKIQELPKISDRIVSLLAPFTVWIQMEDLNLKMPKYSERAVITPIDDELLVTLNQYKVDAIELLHKHNPKLVKSFASRFLYIMNNPAYAYNFTFEGLDEIIDEETMQISRFYKEFSLAFPAFDENRLFNKEKALIAEVTKASKLGRKVLLYSMYNKAALVADRCKKVLSLGEETKDLDVRIMPDTISGERILPWIEANSEADVVIASHLKLATGFNLVQFPTIIFYETGTKVREVQQASKRSWRAVGQSNAVEVVFLAYQGSQAKVLDVIAKKMRAAATIEGKRVEEGQIASAFDDDAEITSVLNEIASSIAETNDTQADFEGTTIEEGVLRKSTKLEAIYESILAEVKNVVIDENVKSHIIDEEVEEENLIIEFEEDFKKEEKIDKEEELDEAEKEDIAISCDNSGQAFFNF